MRDLTKLWKARLVLEDGSIWRATSFGAEGEARGEVVFNTALTGYQEVLTDPSYAAQIVTMTYPLIGNYGVSRADAESSGPRLEGFLVREASSVASNYRAEETLTAWLRRHDVVALEGLDTRALTLRIRRRGAMRAYMTTETLTDAELVKRIDDVPDLVGRDIVASVTCQRANSWDAGFDTIYRPRLESAGGRRLHVVAYDFGAKHAIFRSLRSVGCRVTVVPASTSAADVLALDPDGVFLSNGPGDPRPLETATRAVRELLGRVPIFGICLGHQILAQAIGAEITKMKFGHHGSNHPVQDLATGAVEITAQNHGFAVQRESLERLGASVTHVNLNDGSIEGFAIPEKRAFSVQYHPEASPGPHDSLYLFQRFVGMMSTSADASAPAETA